MNIININIIIIFSDWAWEAQIRITLSPKTYPALLNTQHLTLCPRSKTKAQFLRPKPKTLVLTLYLSPIPRIQISSPIPFLPIIQILNPQIPYKS